MESLYEECILTVYKSYILEKIGRLWQQFISVNQSRNYIYSMRKKTTTKQYVPMCEVGGS